MTLDIRQCKQTSQHGRQCALRQLDSLASIYSFYVFEISKFLKYQNIQISKEPNIQKRRKKECMCNANSGCWQWVRWLMPQQSRDWQPSPDAPPDFLPPCQTTPTSPLLSGHRTTRYQTRPRSLIPAPKIPLPITNLGLLV